MEKLDPINKSKPVIVLTEDEKGRNQTFQNTVSSILIQAFLRKSWWGTIYSGRNKNTALQPTKQAYSLFSLVAQFSFLGMVLM